MTNKISLPKPVKASEGESPTIKHLVQILEEESSPTFLVGKNREEIKIPESVYSVLRQVIELMALGKAVSLVPVEHELTTQEAADLLSVSRPFLVKLLEEKEIPYIMVGSHRRIRFEDLMAYKQQRDTERRQILKELTQFSQDEGFYQAEN